jgi:hypothetical protein
MIGALLAVAGAGCGSPTVPEPPPTGVVPVTAADLSAAKGCTPPTGAGTTHANTITTDETWTEADSPHRVPNNLTIEATVTLEPCAVVLLGKQVSIAVGNNPKAGALVARGEVTKASDGSVAARPVIFEAADTTAPWAQLFISPTGTADLSVVTLHNGGDTVVGGAGALRIGGNAGGTNDAEVLRSTTVDRVLIRASRSYGLHLDGWGALREASTTLWIHESGSDEYPYPVRLEPGVAGTLPRGLSTNGNRREGVLMQTSKAFSRSDTLQALGLPYVQRGALYVNPPADGPPVTLTIEPGVTLAFEENAGSGVYFGSSDTRQGQLVAEGTAAAPIVFTSAKPTPAAGDWMALYFRYFPTTGSRVRHARVEYAGGPSGTNGYGCGPQDAGNDSAVIITGQGAQDAEGPATAFITDSVFDHIAGATVIVSGWYGDGPNLATTNTFGANTPACKVSQPRTNLDVGGDFCEGRRGICW